MSTEKPIVSRRRFLVLAAVGSAIAAVVGLGLIVTGGRLQRSSGIAGLSSTTATSARDIKGTLDTVVTFIGAMFGRDLSDRDSAELLERLRQTLEQEPARAEDYMVLAQYLDRRARGAGAAGFAMANTVQRSAIVDQVMQVDPGALWSRVLSHVSSARRQYYRMRSATVPALAWLYRGSSVPWRARGYERWPGIPGDWHEYLTAGKPNP